MNPSPDVPDNREAEAIEEAKKGSEAAFEYLYSQHKRRIYSLCLRMTGDPADAEMRILTLMLSQNLETALRGRNNYVYFAYSYNSPGFDTGTLQIVAQTTPDKYDAMMKEIHAEIDKIKKGEFADEELDRVKRQAISYIELGLQTNASQADIAALEELYGIGYDYATKYPVRLAKVTREDVMKLVQRCFGEWMVVETRPAPAAP